MPTLTFTQVMEGGRNIALVVGSPTIADIVIPKGSKADVIVNVIHIRTPEKTNKVSFYLRSIDFVQAQDFCKTDRERLIECSTRAGAYRGPIQEMLARPEPITMTVEYDKD